MMNLVLIREVATQMLILNIRKGREMKIKVTKRPTTTKEKVIGGAGWIAVIGCIVYLIIK